MPSCAAVGCTCRTGSGQQHGRTFYGFPLKKPDLLKKWLVNMNRPGFVPTTNSRLCSAHFLDTCFKEDLYAKYVGVTEGQKRQRRLKEDAAPTEFEHGKVEPLKERASSVSRIRQREGIIKELKTSKPDSDPKKSKEKHKKLITSRPDSDLRKPKEKHKQNAACLLAPDNLESTTVHDFQPAMAAPCGSASVGNSWNKIVHKSAFTLITELGSSDQTAVKAEAGFDFPIVSELQMATLETDIKPVDEEKLITGLGSSDQTAVKVEAGFDFPIVSELQTATLETDIKPVDEEKLSHQPAFSSQVAVKVEAGFDLPIFSEPQTATLESDTKPIDQEKVVIDLRPMQLTTDRLYDRLVTTGKRFPAERVSSIPSTSQTLLGNHVGCQTDLPGRSSQGTQLSLRTLSPHVRSKGTQVPGSVSVEVGTTTTDAPWTTRCPLVSPTFKAPRPAKRPQIDVEEEDQGDLSTEVPEPQAPTDDPVDSVTVTVESSQFSMSTLPYQKVVWKEQGTPVSRIVPVNWIMESHDKTFIAWPNKVNAQKDIKRRTKPGNDWQFFKVLKRKQFYETWDEESDCSEFMTTEPEGNRSGGEQRRSQRKKRGANSCNEEAISHLRRQLTRSKADKRGDGVPAIPDVFEDINKEATRKRAIDTKSESMCCSMIDDDDREMVSESELSDMEEAERLKQLDGDDISSDSEIDQPTKRRKMSKGGEWDRSARKKTIEQTCRTSDMPMRKVLTSYTTPQPKPSSVSPTHTTPKSGTSRRIEYKTAKPSEWSQKKDQTPQREMDIATLGRTLLGQMSEIKDMLRSLSTRLSNLEKKGKGTSISDALRILPQPLETKEGVDALEETVSSCEANRSAVVDMLSQVGGQTPARLAVNIVNRMMKCTAQLHFNIRGTGQKVTFKSYRLYTMIFEAVKLAFPTERANLDKVVHTAILDTLRSAGAKVKRLKTVVAQNATASADGHTDNK
ncbi:uncharacterized protein LOC132881935 isoform X3 [Neoarius graeffei]|uniref:uncharacterized protein LOC132881935 isoform X3 n=1 Tax=Neoarius graeffei TaxID=443677 RepID=UPI00298CCE55|nr:uncharacterized protein LOC132881935 isoform X3 [Neoarius graeffei]